MRKMTLAGVVLGLSGFAVCGSALAQEKLPATPPSAQAIRNDRVVIYGMAPIPDVGPGAPRFSSSDIKAIQESARRTQLDAQSDARRCRMPTFAPCLEARDSIGSASLGCEMEAAQRAMTLAARAETVTRAAEDARRDLASGKGTLKQAEDAELARQQAVIAMEQARQRLLQIQANIGTLQKLKLMRRKNVGWGDLVAAQMSRERKGYDIFASPDEMPAGLRITNVRATDRTDRKGSYTVVFGDIQNEGAKSARIPDLSAALVDDKGWVLHKTVVSPGNRMGSIKAGKSYAFGLEIRPAADAGNLAVVTFAAKNAPPPRMRMSVFCSGVLDQ